MSTEPPGIQPHPFAAELARRRHKANLSQRDLARLADISESGLRRLEKGWEDLGTGPRQVKPSKSTVVKLAAALDWPPRTAAKKAGYDAVDVPAAVEKPTPPAELIQYWTRLTAKQRDLIMDVVREFATANVSDNRTSAAQLF